MSFIKTRNESQKTLPAINIAAPSILAYDIWLENKPTNCQFLITDEKHVFFIENGIVTKQWAVLRIYYDSSGGEIITKEGDTIFISKNIVFKEKKGDEVIYEYRPIDISTVSIRNEYLKSK